MKRLLHHFFTLSIFLLTLSFSFETFASGQPSIRTVAQGGGGQPDPCIPNNGNDYTLKLEVAIAAEDMDFFNSCNLYVGYESLLSGTTYQIMPVAGFLPSIMDPEIMVQSFEVLLTGAEIEEMCNQEIYTVNVDLYCLVYDVFESLSNGFGNDFGVHLCCADRTTKSLTNDDDNIYTLIDKADSKINNEKNLNQFSDYYIYDIHGNQVNTLKNKSNSISVQEHIANLPIQTGIYFVRFWNGNALETQKVFKL